MTAWPAVVYALVLLASNPGPAAQTQELPSLNRVQRELPGLSDAGVPEEFSPRRGREHSPEFGGRRRTQESLPLRPRRRTQSGDLFAQLLQGSLFLLAGVVLFLLLRALWPRLRKRKAKTKRGPKIIRAEAVPAREPEETGSETQGLWTTDPEDLAKAGRYGDAVLALARSELKRRAREAGLSWPIDHSRERLMRLLSINRIHLPSCSRLVALADRVQFGGLTAGLTEWQEAKDCARGTEPQP